MTSSIKVIIFDMDGVLVDATAIHFHALNRALEMFGYTISEGEHHSIYNGLPTAEKLRIMSKHTSLPLKLHRIISVLKQKFTKEEMFQRCVPAFRIEYMIRRLKGDGFVLGVCSNSIRDSVVTMLTLSGIIESFTCVLSNQDVTNSKPDPEIYLKAFQLLKINPSNVVIVEDSPHGIESAIRSGANVCKVKGYYEVSYDFITSFISNLS